MDRLCQCCTVKVPAPPGRTVIDCKVHLEVIPGYAYQHSFPSHFPQLQRSLLLQRRTEISINQKGAQWGPQCARVKRVLRGAYCSRITVCAHTQIRVLCRRTQYNERSRLRMRCKNSNCHVWCCLFQCDPPRGIGFDDHDKCGAELQMLMKYMSAFLCSPEIAFELYILNWAKHMTFHLSRTTFTLEHRL